MLHHGCLVRFVNIANNTSLFAKKHNFSEKITGKWQNNIFISNKYVSQAYQMLQTTKMDIETDCLLRLTSFQKQQFKPLNLLQICPSMSCIYAVLFIPCFNILSSYFYVLLNLVRYSSCCLRFELNLAIQLL